ncbi:MAG: alpha/beta hydrolase [Chloroflexi bacterium]|nr:alpha/beta hydrolase [Chloroflexota bacterium]
MGKAQINGIEIHYQQKGEGPDVVLVHGVTSTMAVWYNQVMPALRERFRITLYDLRGHGYSEMTPTGYNTDTMSDDLLGLMDHLKLDGACVVGHSYGGAIGLHAAVKQQARIRGLVVSDTGVACLRHLRNIQDWAGWSLFKEQLEARGITYDQFTDDAERIFRRSLEIPKQFGLRKGEPRANKRLQKLLDETTMAKEFREIGSLTEEAIATVRIPVLALYGDQSPYKGLVVRLKELLPVCHWDVLTGTGHFLLLQNPDIFVQRILAFLDDPRRYVEAQSRSSESACARPEVIGETHA